MHSNTVIIHDLQGDALRLLPRGTSFSVIDANEQAAYCIGCFGCWLKTPGVCILKDGLQHAGATLPQSDEIIIVSQNCYGGYSPSVKKVLDRSIAADLPFFTLRGGEVHHPFRYKKRPACKVFLYGDATPFEKETAQKLVQANALNLAWQQVTLTFIEDIETLGEVWQ
ncbi:flavodoxin family protein [Ruminococcaceae bacterium OttesenSCG-928-N02]|nr:flavodoxin family protein [Ruminococcaceae bacterium OttesenSCG-928-N02]